MRKSQEPVLPKVIRKKMECPDDTRVVGVKEKGHSKSQSKRINLWPIDGEFKGEAMRSLGDIVKKGKICLSQ